jgi:hypothetical protein
MVHHTCQRNGGWKNRCQVAGLLMGEETFEPKAAGERHHHDLERPRCQGLGWPEIEKSHRNGTDQRRH